MGAKLRVHRHRWWFVPALTAFGAVSGAFFSAAGRFGRFGGPAAERPWPTADAFLSAVAAGAVCGAVVALMVVFVYALRDSTVIAVRRAYPNSVVVQARWETEGPVGTRARTWFALAFDATGMRIFGPAITPQEVSHIEWSRIAQVAVGETYLSTSRYVASHDRLAVTAIDGAATVTLQLGIELEPRVYSAQTFASAQEIFELAQRIDDVRDGILRVNARTSASPLVAGPTAWNASQIAVLLSALAGVFAIALGGLAVLVDANVSREAALWTLCGLALPVTAAAVALAVSLRAAVRERRAGYTTRNGVHLDRIQRHPRTGTVIRRAGAPAIDPRDFVRILASNQ